MRVGNKCDQSLSPCKESSSVSSILFSCPAPSTHLQENASRGQYVHVGPCRSIQVDSAPEADHMHTHTDSYSLCGTAGLPVSRSWHSAQLATNWGHVQTNRLWVVPVFIHKNENWQIDSMLSLPISMSTETLIYLLWDWLWTQNPFQPRAVCSHYQTTQLAFFLIEKFICGLRI